MTTTTTTTTPATWTDDQLQAIWRTDRLPVPWDTLDQDQLVILAAYYLWADQSDVARAIRAGQYDDEATAILERGYADGFIGDWLDPATLTCVDDEYRQLYHAGHRDGFRASNRIMDPTVQS